MTVQLRRLAAVLACCLLLWPRVFAQTIQEIDPAKLPRFEVASVKPADPNAVAMIGGVPGRSFRQENMWLLNAVEIAFRVDPYQLGKMPDLIRDGRFTINARMPAGASAADLPLMVRALLIDRFQLRYHIEHTETEGYALTLNRRDRHLGPRLQPSRVDCAAKTAASTPRADGTLPPAVVAECSLHTGPGGFHLHGRPMATIVLLLSRAMRVPVLDNTGLTGNFDAELEYSPASVAPLRAIGDAPAPDDGPSVFNAVQEQLGLKLTPGKAPMDRLVIDHIERPDPD